MPKKQPFVKSNYERIEGDYYPTIDIRCIWSFLEHFKPTKPVVDICAPEGSGIVYGFLDSGFEAVGLPDAFEPEIKAEWIVTNPPYNRPLVNDILRRQILRIQEGEVLNVAMLLRSYFDHAKERKEFFRDCPYYAGQIRFLFRPWWNEKRDKGPIHNFVWHIWQREQLLLPSPVVWYAEGEPALPLLSLVERSKNGKK